MDPMLMYIVAGIGSSVLVVSLLYSLVFFFSLNYDSSAKKDNTTENDNQEGE